jgi:hypothetical protein
VNEKSSLYIKKFGMLPPDYTTTEERKPMAYSDAAGQMAGANRIPQSIAEQEKMMHSLRGTVGGGPVAARGQGDMADALDRLMQAQEALQTSVARLRDKAEPLLAPDEPEKAGGGGNAVDNRSSAAVESIRMAAHRTHHICAQVDSLLRRLTV